MDMRSVEKKISYDAFEGLPSIRHPEFDSSDEELVNVGDTDADGTTMSTRVRERLQRFDTLQTTSVLPRTFRTNQKSERVLVPFPLSVVPDGRRYHMLFMSKKTTPVFQLEAATTLIMRSLEDSLESSVEDTSRMLRCPERRKNCVRTAMMQVLGTFELLDQDRPGTLHVPFTSEEFLPLPMLVPTTTIMFLRCNNLNDHDAVMVWETNGSPRIAEDSGSFDIVLDHALGEDAVHSEMEVIQDMCRVERVMFVVWLQDSTVVSPAQADPQHSCVLRIVERKTE